MTKEEFEQVKEAQPAIYTTIPEQGSPKPGQLTRKQLVEYFDKGFIVLHDFVDTKLLDDVRDDISRQVDELAEKLFAAGKIQNTHEEKGLHDRMIFLDKEYPGIAVLTHKSDNLPPAFQRLWNYEKLLNVVEQIIGPEISGHPVWNLRPKVPRNEDLTVPWHHQTTRISSQVRSTVSSRLLGSHSSTPTNRTVVCRSSRKDMSGGKPRLIHAVLAQHGTLTWHPTRCVTNLALIPTTQ